MVTDRSALAWRLGLTVAACFLLTCASAPKVPPHINMSIDRTFQDLQEYVTAANEALEASDNPHKAELQKLGLDLVANMHHLSKWASDSTSREEEDRPPRGPGGGGHGGHGGRGGPGGPGGGGGMGGGW